MRTNYLHTCDLLLLKAKPSTLRTSDAETTNEAKVNERTRLASELGDPENLRGSLDVIKAAKD